MKQIHPLTWLSLDKPQGVLVLSLLSMLGAFAPLAAADPAKVLLGRLDQADAIVIGQAVAMRQDTVEEAPVSLVRFKVMERIRGQSRPEIEIVVPRTLIQPGKMLLETGPQDQPLLGVGEEALLFLSRYPGREDSYSIISGDLGKYAVRTDGAGEKRADRYLLASPTAEGVPLRSLVAQIRSELKIPEDKPAVTPKP